MACLPIGSVEGWAWLRAGGDLQVVRWYMGFVLACLPIGSVEGWA